MFIDGKEIGLKKKIILYFLMESLKSKMVKCI